MHDQITQVKIFSAQFKNNPDDKDHEKIILGLQDGVNSALNELNDPRATVQWLQTSATETMSGTPYVTLTAIVTYPGK